MPLSPVAYLIYAGLSIIIICLENIINDRLCYVNSSAKIKVTSQIILVEILCGVERSSNRLLMSIALWTWHVPHLTYFTDMR